MIDNNIRLVACAVVRTRFAGRADLERRAERDPIALAELEIRLGLADESARTAAEEEVAETYLLSSSRRYDDEFSARYCVGLSLGGRSDRIAYAARLYATDPRAAHVARAVAPRACAEIDAKRAARKLVAKNGDKISSRAPGYVVRRYARGVIRRSSIRTATHDHTTYVASVAIGRETATSATSKISSSSAGLCNAYCRKAFFVASSEHSYSVSAAILTPAVRALQAAARGDVVYLAVDTRVRNGRGTSLFVERLTARGAWRAQ